MLSFSETMRRLTGRSSDASDTLALDKTYQQIAQQPQADGGGSRPDPHSATLPTIMDDAARAAIRALQADITPAYILDTPEYRRSNKLASDACALSYETPFPGVTILEYLNGIQPAVVDRDMLDMIMDIYGHMKGTDVHAAALASMQALHAGITTHNALVARHFEEYLRLQPARSGADNNGETQKPTVPTLSLRSLEDTIANFDAPARSAGAAAGLRRGRRESHLRRSHAHDDRRPDIP